MNAAESKNLATVLKMLGGSTHTEECYQDLKEPGDFAKFLSCEQKTKVSYPSNKSRVLEDTRGHVYYFKRTINKKNKFGKACRCGVWVCKHYRRRYCCCAVYTFGDTIVGSTGPHNHLPTTKETDESSKQQRDRLEPGGRLNFKIPAALKNKVRRHNSGPKVDSIKRSVQRAREQLNSKRKRRCVKKHAPKPKLEVKKEELKPDVNKCAEEDVKPDVKVEVGVKAQPVEPEAPAVKKESAEAAPPGERGGEKKDTLNEILEILNDLSKNSSHSYQTLCSQLLSEYMTGQTGEAGASAANISPRKMGTISSITIPLQDFPVSSPGMITSSSTSSTSSATSTPSSTRPPATSHTTVSSRQCPVSSGPPQQTTSAASQRGSTGDMSHPEISVISSNFNTSDILTSGPRPFVKSAPPPNVTIAYNKEPSKAPAVNPDLRPVINIPSLFDTPPVSSSPELPITVPSDTVTSSQPTMTSSQPTKTSAQQLPMTSHCKSPELPPRSEYNILSDMTSLENLLDILKENSPIRDAGALRCTCKTMLRCNLHDIGPGKKRQTPIKPRKVLTRNDDAPKPARKKYCYRGSKKPYKFIPETFKDCQLPANEDTVIGTAGHSSVSSVVTNTTTSKKGRGGRRSRGVKPVNLPPPPPPPTVPPVSHVPTAMSSGVGLTPISPAPEPRGNAPGNTINLVPVTSVSAPSFENSKLLKAVPIGNGLYRLEEANESEMQAGALSKPIFTTDFGIGGGIVAPSGSVPMVTPTGSNVPFSPTLAPMFGANQRNSNKPLTVIEHHPTSSFSDSRSHAGTAGMVSQANNSQTNTPAPVSSDVTNQLNSLLTSVLSSINSGMNNTLNNTLNSSLNNSLNNNLNNNLSNSKPKSDSVPLMIPAGSPGDENVSSALVNQLIERLLSVDSTGAGGEEKLLEAVSSNLPGITQH